ncbi:MAG: hypothetical protein HC850_06240 [Rhodomicrobium sp.]|nr:hypothetical protein [Rhodomicrobium sp.]
MRQARTLIFAAIAFVGAMPAIAEDFSKDSQANSWGLTGETKARFAGKVVDMLCELTGQCAESCGGGTQQLGIVRSADNALVPVLKNGQPLFNGAIPDLMPYCGQMVEVDGLLIGDENGTDSKFYQIQLIRRQGESEWQKTELWSKKWDADHPKEAAQPGDWYRKDPVIVKHIEKNGYFGLGKAVDEQWIKENF